MPCGIYIHFPFCKSKCPYCAFTSSCGLSEAIPRYAAAAANELSRRLDSTYSKIPDTVYIGGGTPSTVSPEYMAIILEPLDLSSVSEFTVEANPESLTDSWLVCMRRLGVDRLSLGVQSLDNLILANLGRIHTAQDAVTAYTMARKAGFKSLSVDIMFGVPGQTIESWKTTLEGITALEPDHVSAYSLSVEEDTGYFSLARKGSLDIPSDDDTAAMYGILVETMRKAGLERYEISNFAHPGFECRHNQSYWDFTPYLGIGASSHSFDGTIRSWNQADTLRYMEFVESGINTIEGFETIDSATRLMETVMLSLRTQIGLELNTIDFIEEDALSSLVRRAEELASQGLLTIDKNKRVELTDKGAILADEVIGELIYVL